MTLATDNKSKTPALERPPEPPSALTPAQVFAALPVPGVPAGFQYDPSAMSLLPDGRVMAIGGVDNGLCVAKFPSREAAMLSMSPENKVETEARSMYWKSADSGSATWYNLPEEDKVKWRALAQGKYDAATSKPPAPAPQAASPEGPEPGKGKYVGEPLHEIPEKVDPLLTQILSWPRRHSSYTELAFCRFVRGFISGVTKKEPLILAEGCIVATIPRPAKAGEDKAAPSTVLFSCHVDTVEGDYTGAGAVVTQSDDEPVIPRKKLNYDPNFGIIGLEKDSIGGSLGADDGAGVWLMLKMIERKVPGTYIFHRGEEVGCIGSKAMADKYPEMLKAFDCAVAFDRHDTYEVIHTQGNSTCASMKFTQALCNKLNEKGMKYEPSSRGVLTDTKQYRRIIAECINIGVGYEGQHGRNETLNYAHLAALLEAVCAIDWDALPVDRDPTATEYGSYSGSYHSGSYHGGYGRSRAAQESLLDDDDQVFQFPQGGNRGGSKNSRKKNKKQQQQRPAANQPMLTVSQEMSQFSLEEIENWAIDNPEDAAKTIGQLLVEIASLKATNDTVMTLMGFKDEQ